MKILIASLMAAILAAAGDGLEMASNYAKVSVNKGVVRKSTSNLTTSTPVTTTIASANYSVTVLPIDSDEESDEEEYDDFDDLQAATESTRSQSLQKGAKMPQNLMTYVNGLVNLLALFVNSGGRRKDVSKPRLGDKDDLVENINSLAEGRFHPSTATKKFKTEQGVYDGYQQYNANSDSYNSNGGKTSYDSDSMQYNVKNPDDIEANSEMSEATKMKNPMNDYMSQNHVEIYPSYSYEITEPPKSKHPIEPPGYSYMTPQPREVYYPMKKKMKSTPQPYVEEDQPDYAIQPWMTKPQPPPEMAEDHPELSPVYHPWLSKDKPKKAKPVPPPEESEGDEPDHHYYPWLSHSPPKKSKPPPPAMLEDHPDEEEAPVYPWDIKKKPAPPPVDMPEDEPWSSGKAKPPKDDHPQLYYPYYPDHDHFIHDDHHHDEEEHDMKDEDRESKHPYGYYHLGRKLWYIPLFFSLYFIIYIGALILKSIARHKIQLPEKLHDLADHHHGDRRRQSKSLNEITQRVHDSIDNGNSKYM